MNNQTTARPVYYLILALLTVSCLKLETALGQTRFKIFNCPWNLNEGGNYPGIAFLIPSMSYVYFALGIPESIQPPYTY